ncbi:MAG: hypothetical protein RIR46_1176 [Actinomycetota bacterium]|jgi:hypothetical protein
MMRRIFALAAVAALLTGCAQLPRSGAIGVGPAVQVESTDDYLYYSPSLPSPGDSQQQIVSGFLSAGNGPQNDYEVARSYLSSSFKADWSASDEVLVQQGATAFDLVDETTARVELQVSATIDANGVYEAQTSQVKRYLDFELVQESGEWRISKAPNLTVLISPNFSVLFKPYQVYFYDSTHLSLVPDIRWFPSRTSTATELMQALLNGPRPWMRGALAWDFPEGTTLSLNSVTITDGVANVDFSDELLRADAQALRHVQAQVKATLLQIPSVERVKITVNRNDLGIDEIQVPMPQAYASAPVTLDSDGLFQSGKTSAVYLPASSSAMITGAREFALDSDAKKLGFVTELGLYQVNLLAIDKSPSLVDPRSGLLAPSWDNRGFLWSVGSAQSSTWRVFDTLGNAKRVDTSVLAGSATTVFGVSPDGARIAALHTGAKSGIWLYPVIRDTSGLPLKLGNGVPQSNTFGDTFAMSWADAGHIAALVTDASGSIRPTVMTIGGTTRVYTAVPGARQIVANLNGPFLFVLKDDGTLLQSRSSVWSEIQLSVRTMHFAGH